MYSWNFYFEIAFVGYKKIFLLFRWNSVLKLNLRPKKSFWNYDKITILLFGMIKKILVHCVSLDYHLNKVLRAQTVNSSKFNQNVFKNKFGKIKIKPSRWSENRTSYNWIHMNLKTRKLSANKIKLKCMYWLLQKYFI